MNDPEARYYLLTNPEGWFTIYDIAEAEGRHFIVMQYVAGKTLRQLLARGALELGEALRYAIQIADGLSRAHTHGIVHRDLKPENVMVNEEGQVKILDFGLAKLLEPPEVGEAPTREQGQRYTEEGHILGTTAYMSPEQAQGRKVDARSDIFSLPRGRYAGLPNSIKRLTGAGGISVSPDGQWVPYTQNDSSGADLMLIENFR